MTYLIQLIPVLALLIVYFVRLEIRLAKMSRDICWIKKMIAVCQPHLDQSTQ
ncbi:hypothetical protein ES702_06496 [subsurface metagenome]